MNNERETVGRLEPRASSVLELSAAAPDLSGEDQPPARGAAGVLVMSPVRFYREGLAKVFVGVQSIEVVGTAPDARSARSLAGSQQLCVDVVLLDETLGLEALQAVKQCWPSADTIVIAVADRLHDVMAWADAGIAGFVTREQSLDDLIAAVLAACNGEMRCAPHLAAALLRRVATLAAGYAGAPLREDLTVREREIALLLEQGLSNKEIASRLYIQLPTVKNHVHNILQKLQVNRRGEAAAHLRRAGV